MKNKPNEKDNYVDRIPTINKHWELLKDGIVEVTVENKGFYNTLAQKLYKKPRFSFIKLDEYGSFVWQQIDGQVDINEIGKRLAKKYPGAKDKLYERLCGYFKILEKNGYVTMRGAK